MLDSLFSWAKGGYVKGRHFCHISRSVYMWSQWHGSIVLSSNQIWLCFSNWFMGTSLVTQMIKSLPAMQETWVGSLGWKYPLEKGKATQLFWPRESMDCGKNTGAGSLSLLQGFFPTQGSNPGLLHCREILYHLSHQGSPISGSKPFKPGVVQGSTVDSNTSLCHFHPHIEFH